MTPEELVEENERLLTAFEKFVDDVERLPMENDRLGMNLLEKGHLCREARAVIEAVRATREPTT